MARQLERTAALDRTRPRPVRFSCAPQPPHPSTVRPQPVLERALEHVLGRYVQGADYKAFVNDQFKSIRQDLVVQCIRNEFAVSV